MGLIASLFREIVPNWMMQTEPTPERSGKVVSFRPKRPAQYAREADAIWRDHIQKGLFGADTSDYTDVRRSRPDAEPRAGHISKH